MTGTRTDIYVLDIIGTGEELAAIGKIVEEFPGADSLKMSSQEDIESRIIFRGEGETALVFASLLTQEFPCSVATVERVCTGTMTLRWEVKNGSCRILDLGQYVDDDRDVEWSVRNGERLAAFSAEGLLAL
jgi:hypothetical protein